ncbi:uncharacterized protein LOC110853042 [Folsomia candida]|uniref:uncharacterized protein LOC110853042 n=1 Tax=Folsomia candida TaxID=158441 RepID=UPI000B8FF7FB|nr:uncharacterized protein LOC110853042 [Folsomia candida]
MAFTRIFALICGLVCLSVLNISPAEAQTCSRQVGKDITAPNLRSINGTAETSCCGLCSSTSGCVAYSWNDYQGGTCWLKGALSPVIDKGDTTIGIIGGSQNPFKVVAFWRGTWDVAHISFANEANRYFPTIQAELGFTYEATTDWSRINDNYLADKDVILFLDDKPTDASHKSAVERFTQRGGGFMSFHVAAFTTNANEWAWYHNTFLGTGNFQKNTWKPTPATLRTEDRTHPATRNLPATWSSQHNEWYAFANDIRNNINIRILLSIDPSSFPLGTNAGETWYEGYYPVVWQNRNYRMLYCNMGHNDIDYNGNIDLSETFGGQIQNTFFKDALKWLAYRDAPFEESKQNPLFEALNA